MSDLDHLVNPSNTEIPLYTESTANLPPIEGLPLVYDVLVTSEMQSKGQLPCWGLGKYRPDYDLWEFSEKECKYLGGTFEHLLTFDANWNKVVDANGNTTQIKPLLGSCSRGETYHFEKRSVPVKQYDSDLGVWYDSAQEQDVKIVDKPGMWYTRDCARSAIYGPDTRRDVQNYESAEDKRKVLLQREYEIRGKLTSCYLLGKINDAKDDLIYTREECDILQGLFDNGKCHNPFNKPVPYGGGCADLDAIAKYNAEKEERIGKGLRDNPKFKKGNILTAAHGTTPMWDKIRSYWWAGDEMYSDRTAEEFTRYNMGITDQDIDNYKNNHPELVLWSPPPPPPSAEELAAKHQRDIYESNPVLYEKTTRLREPPKEFKNMPNLDNFDKDGKKIGVGIMGHELDPDEEALYQELKSMTKDQIIARGGLQKYFGLFDFGGPDIYKWESKAQVNKDALLGNPYTCELLGDKYYTERGSTSCKGRTIIPSLSYFLETTPRLIELLLSHPNSVVYTDGPDGDDKGVYGVPGNYSYEYYYRLHSQKLFVTEPELQDYNKRNGIVKLPPPPPVQELIQPPPPVSLTPLEEARKALNEQLVTQPSLIPLRAPKTVDEHAAAFKKKVEQFDKTADNYTYYAIVGGIGLAAYFLVK